MTKEEIFKNNDINNKLDKLFDYLKETNKTNNIQIENINKRLDKIELKIFKEKNNDNVLFSDKKEFNVPIINNCSSINLESNVEKNNSRIALKNDNKSKNNNIRGTYKKQKTKVNF